MQQVRLVLDSNVRRISNGTALLGGSPFRVIRLSPAGARLLDRWLAGDEVASAPAASELRQRLLRAGIVHPIPSTDVPPPSFAVVVPVFNDVAGLTDLLRSLQTECSKPRIIVVDDASSDATKLAHVCTGFGAELLRHETNRGPGAARNTGLQHLCDNGAEPEVVVFIDADARPQPGAIQLILRHFADPGVTAVGPRILASPGADWVARYEADNSALDMGADPSLVVPGSRVSYVPTAAFAIRSEAVRSAGGFADLRYGEDVDLVWRLFDAGATVRYEPRSIVTHRTRDSVAEFARQRFRYGTAAAPLARHHHDKIAPLQLPADLVVTTLGALFGGPVLKVLAAVAALARTKRLADTLATTTAEPTAEAVRLTALGHGYAALGLATAATRSWAPLLLLTRPSRRALAAATAIPALVQWVRIRPANDPISHVVLRAVDHGSYCAGVWVGGWRERSVAALLPQVRLPDFVIPDRTKNEQDV